jgi:hypothetical protein
MPISISIATDPPRRLRTTLFPVITLAHASGFSEMAAVSARNSSNIALR